jgi:hypothetical protein
MTIRHIFIKADKRTIINHFRTFASTELHSNNIQDHRNFANTIINGKRQNADKFFNYLSNTTQLPSWITKDTVHNLLRRAVGKGSLRDSASPEAIKMFNDWIPMKSNIKSVSILDIACRSKYEEVRPATTVKQSGVMHASAKATPPAKKVVDVKVPTTTVEIIEEAISRTTFTATELLTKKFTIVEFLQRIGIKVQA